ncbi:hypothetical protein PAXRUDRAFT_19729 [Paxillus rubicundulus Ve08.2h10]|uniref:Uncharacterized protein n=1 Tax=Paxillus rubicundulus Ve08.2h10 TaxID=930991 RepID=A0A0D0CU26_9AGAM|nr:hypothetical protein PAXRUDRAFT_19729 [Paxillus rubicundulus Ve08.2h10]
MVPTTSGGNPDRDFRHQFRGIPPNIAEFPAARSTPLYAFSSKIPYSTQWERDRNILFAIN